MDDVIEITRIEYEELLSIKHRYLEIMKYNVIKLSGGTTYCRICCTISKQSNILNKQLYDKEWFKSS